jgi:hypothetical protein
MTRTSEDDAAKLFMLLGKIDIDQAVPDISDEISAGTGIHVDLCRAMVLSLRWPSGTLAKLSIKKTAN